MGESDGDFSTRVLAKWTRFRGHMVAHWHDVSRQVTKEDTDLALRSSFVGTVGGFVFGGMASCKETAEKHIEASRSTRYKSQFHAQRELNDVVAREFARAGFRVGARTGTFVGVFMGVSLAAEKVRGTKDALNAIAGGAIAGGSLGLTTGPRGIGRGILIGSGVSCIYGLLLQALWTLEAHVAPPVPYHVAREITTPESPTDKMATPEQVGGESCHLTTPVRHVSSARWHLEPRALEREISDTPSSTSSVSGSPPENLHPST